MAHDPRLEHLTAGHFFGCNERLEELGGLVLSEVTYAPGQRVPPHGHELGYFCLVVHGGYREQYGHRRVICESSSIVFHPPGDEHHGDISTAGLRSFNVEICPRHLARLRDHGELPNDPVDLHGGDLVWLANRLYREFRRTEAGSPLVVEGLGLELLGGLVRERASHEPRPPRWLRAVVDRLHEELDRPLTIEAMATDLGIGAVRLSRTFRRCYGTTIGEYRRRLRVERACHLLVDPEARLADVAVETGFADQSHFTRVFKRQTGLTPGEFRRLRAI